MPNKFEDGTLYTPIDINRSEDVEFLEKNRLDKDEVSRFLLNKIEECGSFEAARLSMGPLYTFNEEGKLIPSLLACCMFSTAIERG